jgi:exopolyphosphatase/guanosine-5'-triphosphate,3'-diphosphate pyrophosphatase
MRAACIDIGSNTTRLLVADCDGHRLDKLEQRRAYTHLCRFAAPGHAITAEKIAEVVAVVEDQLAVARALGAEWTAVVGTAAVRRAGNGAELARALEERCGVRLRIVAGEEEARMAFRGACAALDDAGEPSGRLGVVDVGGGSSELIVGAAPDRVEWWESRALGSGDLAAACFDHDPPSAAELAAARDRAQEALAGLVPPRPERALAVGGSAASLLPLIGPCLDARAFAAALALLLGGPAPVVAERFDLDGERVRLLPAGLIILQAAQARLGVPLQIVGGGLREGILLEAAGG